MAKKNLARTQPSGEFGLSALRMMSLGSWLALFGIQCSRAYSQAYAAGESRASLGASVAMGGMKTQIQNYTFNALGSGASLFLQSSPVLGVEVRGGVYPIAARFSQAPITGGFRFGTRPTYSNHIDVFAYIGGGMSKSQDAGPHYVATTAKWSPCWQASQGMDLPIGRAKWRLYEVTWTQTYTPLRVLHGFSLASGISFVIP